MSFIGARSTKASTIFTIIADDIEESINPKVFCTVRIIVEFILYPGIKAVRVWLSLI